MSHESDHKTTLLHADAETSAPGRTQLWSLPPTCAKRPSAESER